MPRMRRHGELTTVSLTSLRGAQPNSCFAADEPVESLGRELKLPRFPEQHRGEIEALLPLL
jgi:hypothetical protein